MKKYLLFISLLFIIAFTSRAQFFESFNDGTLPPNWELGQGIQVSAYFDPNANCGNDFGLRTPGVGGSNPSKILMPPITYNSAKPFVNTGFKIYVFNSNLNCVPTKPFPCDTYVEVYLVKATVNTAGVPSDPADIYISAPIQVVKANDVNFSYFQNPPIPNGAQYRVLFDFKSSLNCNQPNTKYILDEFSVIETSGGPLPVRFNAFTAVQANGKVALKWQTAQELNNKTFEVQRKFATGGYQSIATVPTKAFNGNSGVSLDYSIDDVENLTGKGQVYYRIKQIDLDGRANFSEIRSVRNNAKKITLSIYPNPGRDFVKLTIPGGTGLADISITDAAGKEIRKWVSTMQKNMEINGLKPGLYSIRVNIKESGDLLVEKFMIQ
jgi:Secretion system C-terminal sorting domain